MYLAFQAIATWNKLWGMKVGDPSDGFGTTSKNWQHLSIETQTLYNVMKTMNKRHGSKQTHEDHVAGLATPLPHHEIVELSHGKSVWVPVKDDNKEGRVVVVLHGGAGYRGMSDGFQTRTLVEQVVKYGGVQNVYGVMGVHFRLRALDEVEASDEQYSTSFSQQIDDAMEAYEWLLKRGVNPKQIVLVGDSFGATLSTALIHRIATMGMEVPGRAVLISGVFDLSMRLSIDNFEEDNCILCPMSLLETMERLYGKDELSPMLVWKNATGKMLDTKFMFVYSGNEEFTRENIEFVKMVKERGVEVSCVLDDQWMIHNYPYMWTYIPEAVSAMQQIAQFIQHDLPTR